MVTDSSGIKKKKEFFFHLVVVGVGQRKIFRVPMSNRPFVIRAPMLY